ncbi:MAG: hypothetical protein IPH53_04690 [Flavobacteriales bacterium]|nr:hypothetical protein [Flavobacteriales bacterium]
MPTAPTDTSIWYVVSGTYTPDSAYAHLAVGNFFSDSLVTPVVAQSASLGSFWVCVSVFQTITANNVDSYWRMNRGEDHFLSP